MVRILFFPPTPPSATVKNEIAFVGILHSRTIYICTLINNNALFSLQDFCWMCLGDWKTHGSEYYECSRYKENPDIVNQSQQAQAREALKKYLFYFERVSLLLPVLHSRN